MNTAAIDPIVNAALYEGYILYPYRPSSKKNCRERFTFGRIYPRAYSAAQNGAESCVMQTECLLFPLTDAPSIEVSVRFLQPMWREVGLLAAPSAERIESAEPEFTVVPELTLNGTLHQTWQEAVERRVEPAPLNLTRSEPYSATHPFHFTANRAIKPLRDEQGRMVAVLQRRQEGLRGELELNAAPLGATGFKLTVRIWNESAVPPAALTDSDAVLMRTFASTHTILQVRDCEFISLTDPPTEFRDAAASCRNIGVWPVLVGDEQLRQRDTLLSSPIILYDYPKVAPESRGDFFDGTEIDVMLSLRVLTMTEDEKREMRDADPLARRILERTASLPPEHLLRMHGTMRERRDVEEFFNPRQRLESVAVDGVPIKPADRVRIRPKSRADALDLLLAGRTAVVEAVEQDTDGRVFLAVVLEDDPGKDLGMMRQPGHRFFYGADEVEPLQEVRL